MIRINKFVLASLAVCSANLAFAYKVDGTAPVIVINNTQFQAQLGTPINEVMKESFKTFKDTANAQLSRFKGLKDMPQAFANANAYSAQSGSLFGYQNYSLFALSTGGTLAAQMPSFSPSYLTDPDKMAEDFQDGDVYAGLGVGFNYFNLGVNAGLLFPGLYLNVKYGAANYDIGKFSIDFLQWGIGAQYEFFKERSLGLGLLKWRGISIGTGLYAQSNELSYSFELKPIKTEFDIYQGLKDGGANSILVDTLSAALGGGTQSLTTTPKIEMGLKTSTYTIPLDAATSVRLLYALNVSAGIGMDFNFGSSDIVMKSKSKITVDGMDTTMVKVTPGEIVLDASSDNGPSFTRLRVMAGVGLNMGPVKIDVPVVYYLASGATFGLTLAFVW